MLNKTRVATCIAFLFVLFSITMHDGWNNSRAFGSTSFGNDYRLLTTTSPGGISDTTTTIEVGSGVTGTFIVDPYTSASTITDTPSTTVLAGNGWRSSGAVGSDIAAGTWSFTVTTQASVTSLLAVGRVKVFAYSTDTLGASISSIGSATGTANVLSVLGAQTETITFSSSSVDLAGRVLVVEYWIDVTSAPLLATTVTFHTASSTQTVVLPSGAATFYLTNPSLFSVGQSESFTTSDTSARSANLLRDVESNAAANDHALRGIIVARDAAEISAGLTDSISKSAGFVRAITESSGANASDVVQRLPQFKRQVVEGSETLVSDSASRTGTFSRQLAESSSASISESVSRLAGYMRDVSESSGAVANDMILRIATYTREISEPSAVIDDLVNIITNLISPPDDGEDDNENDGRGTGRRNRGDGGDSVNLTFEPAYFEDRPLGRIEYTRIALVNSEGAQFSSIATGETINLDLAVLNRQTDPQKYSLILQIVDKGNVAVDIATFDGNLESGKIEEVSLTWVTVEPDEYKLELFIWDEQSDTPIPLGEKITKTVRIHS